VKFVIGNREDFDWSAEMIGRHAIDKRCPVLMSVVFGVLSPLELATWILESRLDARLQLQMHKFIWEPATRGV
jgi:7-carboxy-7-deazaguanine synthase